MPCGRKKEFDKDQALLNAMEVFWEKGYGNASLSDLTTRMGINKPSLYSTFGNKEELFIKAGELYIDRVAKASLDILRDTAVPLKIRIKKYMLSVVSSQCDSGHPGGCLLTLCRSETTGGEMPGEAVRFLEEAGTRDVSILSDIFSSDPESKTLGFDKNAGLNSLAVAVTLRGTSGMARAGIPFSELEYAVDCCLRGIGF